MEPLNNVLGRAAELGQGQVRQAAIFFQREEEAVEKLLEGGGEAGQSAAGAGAGPA